MQMPEDTVTLPVLPNPPAELTSSVLSSSGRTSVWDHVKIIESVASSGRNFLELTGSSVPLQRRFLLTFPRLFVRTC
jgi:hypothetical protein